MKTGFWGEVEAESRRRWACHSGSLASALNQHRPNTLIWTARPSAAMQKSRAGRERSTHFTEEVGARVLIQAPIETEHAKARAVVDGGVLKHARALQGDDLDVDLHGIARLILLEEPQLSRAAPLFRLRKVRHPDRTKYALDRGGAHGDLVHTQQSDARARRAEVVITTRFRNPAHDLGCQPTGSLIRIARHQSLQPSLSPCDVPPADRLPIQPEVPRRGAQAMRLGVEHHRLTVLDAPTVAGGESPRSPCGLHFGEGHCPPAGRWPRFKVDTSPSDRHPR
jgi:hypothetical protein